MGAVTEFFSQPFKGSDKMSAIDWFLFIGLILVLIILWNIILLHIKDVV